MKAKVAVVPLGHAVYFPQFPGLEEELRRKAAAFLSLFDDSTEVFEAAYVDTVDRAFACVRELKAKDADAVVLLLTTYLPSALTMPFAVELQVPLLLAGIQPLDHLDYEKCTTYLQLANDDICAMPEIAGAIGRLGREIPPCVVHAASETDAIRRELRAWQRAVAAKAAFKYAVIGYLGHTYEGMYDMHTDPTAFSRTFHAHVKMLEMCELAARAEAVTQEAVARKVRIIRDTFSIQEPSLDPLTDWVRDEDLEWAAKMACALDDLVESNGLSALAYYYKGENGSEYERIAASLIVGNTLLTSAGIPLAGEADLKTAAAMLIMNRLGGGGSFAELHPFDITDNCVLIGHDGPHNTAIADEKPVLRKLKKYHGKSGSGVSVEFSLKAGPVTLLSIGCTENGRFRFVAARGTSIKGRIPQTGNTNTRVRFDMPVTEFIAKWCRSGPTHHLALGTGDHIESIRHLAAMLDVDLTVVE